MIYPANFFGLTVYPGKTYTTVLEDDTHLTMAALTADLGKNASARTSVILTIDGNPFTLCSLTPGKIENQPIDIYLNQDDEISFTVKGPCPIDITGNVVAIITPEDDMEDFMDGEEDLLEEYGNVENDEEIDSDEVSAIDMDEVDEDGLPVAMDSLVANESDEEEITEAELAILKQRLQEIGDAEDLDDSDEEMMEEDDSEEEDDEEDDEEESDDEEAMEFDAALVAELNKRKMETQPIPRNDKKAKITEIVEEKETKKPSQKQEKKEAATKKPTPAPKEAELKKKDQAKENAKPAAPVAKESPAKKESPAATENKESAKRTLPSGLIIEDAIVGTGPRAKSGQKVSVRYIGKLTNGKVFDSNTKGAPFSFKLGKGQVIKGWDMGVQGMNVGGTRKLTIPAPLAYGKQGAAPDIPKNATLQFEVKLLAIK